MLTADRFAYSKFWALRYKRTEYDCGTSFSTYLSVTYYVSGDFSGDSVVKNPPAMQEVQEKQVRPLGLEDPLEEGRAIHSSILAWRTPWTEEPGGPCVDPHHQSNSMIGSCSCFRSQCESHLLRNPSQGHAVKRS